MVTIDPLLDALCEGAAFWDQLRQDAGGDPANIDGEAVILGLFEIFSDWAPRAGES